MISKKAFTLVELIVVITIIAILWTIWFINLSSYVKTSKDTKRLSDINNIYKKINIESNKGTPLEKLILKKRVQEITINSNSWVLAIQWKINYKLLKENSENFKDGNFDYPIAYAKWWYWKDFFKFISIATVSDEYSKAIEKTNYYKFDENDSPSILKDLNNNFVVNEGIFLPYDLELWIDNLWYINKQSCLDSWWFWSDDDKRIWLYKWNWFCISPRIWDFSNDWPWNWISLNWWWNRTNTNNNWWDTSNITDSGNDNDNFWQTRYLDSNDWYKCKKIWEATSSFIWEDTIVWRMKWLSTNKSNLTELQSINWISNALPPNDHPVPAIFIADCIDWIKDLWTDMTYYHIDDNIEKISYSEYNNNISLNTATWSQTLNNKTYINRQRYLLWWTQLWWWHIPSAYSFIENGFSAADNPDWENLTWIDRWEYQISCENWIYTDWNDNNDNESIWLSSIWDTDWSSWLWAFKKAWETWCGELKSLWTSWKWWTSSARIVIRP